MNSKMLNIAEHSAQLQYKQYPLDQSLGEIRKCVARKEINHSLFRNKRFMLDEMTCRVASKFAIFYIYSTLSQNYAWFSEGAMVMVIRTPKVAFSVFHFVLNYFFTNECPGLCQHRPGHLLGKKIK